MWFAFATGVIVSLLVALGVLLPVLGLIGAAAAAAPIVLVPAAQVALVIVAGYLLALGLLVLSAFSRRGAPAWIASVAAVIATLVVSIAPLVIVAIDAVGDLSEIGPFISDLIACESQR